MTTDLSPEIVHELPPLIAEALEPLIVPIGAVKPHPRNARQGDIGAIVESLRRFGQQKPIVVQRSTGLIVAGNHLWHAMVQLESPTIAANIVDMTDVQAQAFMIADNRTADLGTYDEVALTELLRELAEQDELAGTGYDGDDVDELLSKLNDTDVLGAQVTGSPVVSYTIIFDDEDQLARWNRVLITLRKKYPDYATIAQRLDALFAEVLEEEA